MKRFFYIVIGLLLIAFCVGWFLGPVQDAVMSMINGPTSSGGAFDGQTRSLGRRGGPQRLGGFDLNTVLNAANALIGFTGLVVAMRAGRSRN